MQFNYFRDRPFQSRSLEMFVANSSLLRHKYNLTCLLTFANCPE